jgi:exopolysaccharide production protein ExoZ
LVALGDASYSLYLLHPLVFVSVKAATIPVQNQLWLQEPIRWISIALAIAFSFICYRYFERPMNEIGRRFSIKKLCYT